MSGALSPGQMVQALWTRPGARVHAVIDAAVVPDIAARLKAAPDLPGWDCLQRGALKPEVAARAAYIAELAPAAAFTQWLLHDAVSAFPGWGLLLVSAQPLLAMREHCRRLAEVRTPEGRRRPWRWHDPALLEVLLPTFGAEQSARLFAPDPWLVLPGTRAWAWWRQQGGVPVREERPLLAV